MERERLLLRPGEVAEQMGVCRETVYALIRSGEIPSVRFGGSVRIPLHQLRATIDARAIPHRLSDDLAQNGTLAVPAGVWPPHGLKRNADRDDELRAEASQ